MQQPTKDEAIKELKQAGEKMVKTINELKGNLRDTKSENSKLREIIINNQLEQIK